MERVTAVVSGATGSSLTADEKTKLVGFLKSL